MLQTSFFLRLETLVQDRFSNTANLFKLDTYIYLPQCIGETYIYLYSMPKSSLLFLVPFLHWAQHISLDFTAAIC